ELGGNSSVFGRGRCLWPRGGLVLGCQFRLDGEGGRLLGRRGARVGPSVGPFVGQDFEGLVEGAVGHVRAQVERRLRDLDLHLQQRAEARPLLVFLVVVFVPGGAAVVLVAHAEARHRQATVLSRLDLERRGGAVTRQGLVASSGEGVGG